MNAQLIYRYRRDYDDGAIVEAVIWRLPQPLPSSAHPYKYRLFYGFPALRVIGYDNERGKGDHRHVDGREEPYHFESPELLIDDFLQAVSEKRTP